MPEYTRGFVIDNEDDAKMVDAYFAAHPELKKKVLYSKWVVEGVKRALKEEPEGDK